MPGQTQPTRSLPGHETGREKINLLNESYRQYEAELLAKEAWQYLQKITPIEITHPIPALRAWHLSPNGLLHSVSYNGGEWTGVIARDEVLPTWHNPRGFWAVKPHGVPILYTYRPAVYGIVELVGDSIVEHEHGWRAHMCIIQELYVMPIGHHILEKLAHQYQCEVFPIHDHSAFEEIAFR